tara:strand:+ start:79 stop:204 length:126 start_codon:yes stop_codon:yes gene_type:complete
MGRKVEGKRGRKKEWNAMEKGNMYYKLHRYLLPVYCLLSVI